MSLTNAQLVTLKNTILVDTNLAPLVATNPGAITVYMNQTYTPVFQVWKTSISTQDIFDQITWSNFTPADVPDGTASWTNRSLACQGKQFNIQTMLVGRDTINPSKSNIRAGLQDALTALPSGVGGANRSGGWTNVLSILYRPVTNGEKLFATGTGTTASPGNLVFEGMVSDYDIQMAFL